MYVYHATCPEGNLLGHKKESYTYACCPAHGEDHEAHLRGYFELLGMSIKDIAPMETVTPLGHCDPGTLVIMFNDDPDDHLYIHPDELVVAIRPVYLDVQSLLHEGPPRAIVRGDLMTMTAFETERDFHLVAEDQVREFLTTEYGTDTVPW